MFTATLATVGAALALWIAWRNPGYAERYNWWPTWPEWTVQAFGIGLICTALTRAIFTWMVST